ncbi:MAG: PDZ domain-containing protein, partial [Pseudomonadota bacterium]|nr:PDZ domain-containing protein [Pseudomonadota bacterium]
LWVIAPDSIFEKLGFRNGDTVTGINGNKLVDAGQAIRVLTSLKKAKNLAVDYQRGGSDKQMQIKVQ